MELNEDEAVLLGQMILARMTWLSTIERSQERDEEMYTLRSLAEKASAHARRQMKKLEEVGEL